MNAPVSVHLAPLMGPLRYACERDFARLSSVKGLRLLLEGALLAARRAGVAEAETKPFWNELDGVDHSLLQVRKASLLRVVALLDQKGLRVPPELSSMVATQEKPSLEKASSATSAKPIQAKSPVKKRTQSKATTKKKQSEDEQAKMLSIAPQSGPLAKALNALSGRINPRLLGALYKRGIRRVGDVLFMLPRIYEDRRALRTISELIPGERGVTVGTVRAIDEGRGRGGGRRTFRAVLADSTGSLAATYFQSGPWLKAKFPLGKRLILSGEVRASNFGREMPHPEVEPADDLEQSSVHFKRVVPVYSGFERHEQRALRELTYRLCLEEAQHIEEPLPSGLREVEGLMPLAEAIRQIHFPSELTDVSVTTGPPSKAHERLAFDELFFLQLGMALKRAGLKAQSGIAFKVEPADLQTAKSALPFQLTAAQNRVVGQIVRDLVRPEPMNRLLQGDVGSGKTAVALVTSILALRNGYQVALMAPTEILAEQHARTFAKWLQPLGYETVLLTSGGGVAQRREDREKLARGDFQIAIGTHALIQADVVFQRLGLVIIDEQHRFGVMQRHLLKSKGAQPDFLVMTATPIPRTLAMTLYGDLDVSVIDELPPGRTPIRTKVFPEKARTKVWEQILQEVGKGHQAYIVYPLIEESEKLDLADATQGAASLRASFPNLRVGLLHGRMKDEEKEEVMTAFRDRQLDVLVSTTVIEVGVDVPNASVMIIESAERFGLSQLHQLRGRVGRGAAASYCFLIAGQARSKESAARLAVMEQSNDGFVIAEKDLEIRGPGEFLGTRQSGVPELAVANLTRDQRLLSQARDWARAIVEKDPHLMWPEHQSLIRALEERWQGRLALAKVG